MVGVMATSLYWQAGLTGVVATAVAPKSVEKATHGIDWVTNYLWNRTSLKKGDNQRERFQGLSGRSDLVSKSLLIEFLGIGLADSVRYSICF